MDTGSNLAAMVFDNGARARIARGWLNSSLNQLAYAAMHGISTRTLRDWVCRYGGGRRPQAQLRAAIVASIEQLQNVLVVLDAEVAPGSAAAYEGGPEVARHQSERHAVSAGVGAPGDGTAAFSEPVALAVPGGGPDAAGANRPAAARLLESRPDLVGSGRPGSAGVAGVVLAAGPAAAICRTAAPSTHQPAQGASPSAVVDLDALRKRAAQVRATRAATGTARQPFDWGAE